jgi:hypothetical protein
VLLWLASRIRTFSIIKAFYEERAE